MTPAATSKNDDGLCEPFHTDQVPWEQHARGSRFGMRYQPLSRFGGGTQISVSMEVLAPGRQANPAHDHLLEEEHVDVPEGRLTLWMGERRFELSAGHWVCFPAGQKAGHALVLDAHQNRPGCAHEKLTHRWRAPTPLPPLRRVKGGRSPAKRTLDAAQRETRLWMAVGAAFERLQPSTP